MKKRNTEIKLFVKLPNADNLNARGGLKVYKALICPRAIKYVK